MTRKSLYALRTDVINPHSADVLILKMNMEDGLCHMGFRPITMKENVLEPCHFQLLSYIYNDDFCSNVFKHQFIVSPCVGLK